MIGSRCLAALAAAAVYFGAFDAALAGAPPLEAYGRLPTLSDIVLSPDGTTLAYVRDYQNKRVLIAQSLQTMQMLAAMAIVDSKLRALQWADNDTLVITTSVTARPRGLEGGRREFYLAQTLNVRTKEQHALLDHVSDDLDTLNSIVGTPQPRIVDGHTMVFVPGVFFPGNTGRIGLFRIDLSNYRTRLVSNKRDEHAEDWVIDEAGNIVAEESYFENDQHWKLTLFHDGEADNVVDVAAPIEGPEIQGLSEDGSAIVIARPGQDGNPVYEEISLKDGKTGPWSHGNLAFGNVVSGVRTGKVTGGMRMTDKNDYVFFDAHADKMWRSAKNAFPGATDVDLVSWSDDRTRLVLHVYGSAYGDRYFFVDMTTHKANPIGVEYDGIDQIAPVTWIDYKAADGRVIPAYLTVPLGREAKNLPLVVLPHGGPHSRDEPGFDWLSQALASRGYVVLQPQFRGSDGFGMEFLAAGFGEFGKKMQTDLSDGVRALAAQGLIDPKRVCIVGASYGGYAALAGAAFDSGVYRCAVSIAGLSDLRAQLRYWNWPHNSLDDRSNRFWDRFLGVGDLDDPKLAAISPIKHVDKIAIPILLIHGKDDTVVPFAQSDDMADELKDAKKPFEFVTLKGEDHWLSKSETRLQMLEATVNFLEKNNPPD